MLINNVSSHQCIRLSKGKTPEILHKDTEAIMAFWSSKMTTAKLEITCPAFLHTRLGFSCSFKLGEGEAERCPLGHLKKGQIMHTLHWEFKQMCFILSCCS